MPNPLSMVAPEVGITIANSGDRPLLRHPELAALAIEAIASWSNVESFMLQMFVALMGGNGALAADVFLALETSSAKNAAIRAAATNKFSSDPNKLKLLNALLSVAKTCQKSRNKLAHWTWGDSPGLQNVILLVDPKELIGIFGKPDISKIYVYTAADFQQIINENDQLCGFMLKFKFILDGHIANQSGELFDELCSEPAIRSRLDRPA